MGRRPALFQGVARFAAAAVVDDDGAELVEHRPQQREFLQVVAGDERQVIELVIGGEAVAPALMLRGDDEGPGGQALAAAHLDANAGEDPHRLHHALHIAADHPGGGVPAGGERGEGGGQAVADRQDPVGDVERKASHPVSLAECVGQVHQIGGRP